jgi:hypothetical protein
MVRYSMVAALLFVAVALAQVDGERPFLPVNPTAYIYNNTGQRVLVTVTSTTGTLRVDLNPGSYLQFPFDAHAGDRVLTCFVNKKLVTNRQVALRAGYVYDVKYAPIVVMPMQKTVEIEVNGERVQQTVLENVKVAVPDGQARKLPKDAEIVEPK